MTEQGAAAHEPHEPHEPHEYHPPVEEYLETMLSLSEEGIPVIQARVAERLGRSAPSVSEMLDRLREDGYVTREGRRLSLTESGQALAEKVVRKHRLAERLLVDVIGRARDPKGNVEVTVEGGGGAMQVSSHLSDRLYVGAP